MNMAILFYYNYIRIYGIVFLYGVVGLVEGGVRYGSNKGITSVGLRYDTLFF